MHYTFRYPTTLKVYTALSVVALGLISYPLRLHSWFIIALYSWVVLTSLLYSALSMPRSIEDDGETVVLRRLLWTKRYSRTTYDISEVSGMELTKSYAIVGSAGYFCYNGLFYRSKMGFFNLVATEETGHYLRIQRKGGKRPLYIAYQPALSY